MTCEFSLDHYAELLDAARAGGYRFAHFDRPPEAGDVLLRHDVDLSLDAALRLAELEAAAGATATYFLMTESVFYNLAAAEGREAIARLRGLGHRVGLRDELSRCRDGLLEAALGRAGRKEFSEVLRADPGAVARFREFALSSPAYGRAS